MRKPTSCTNEGEYPARFRVWMKNGDPESVSSTFNCFVPMIDHSYLAVVGSFRLLLPRRLFRANVYESCKSEFCCNAVSSTSGLAGCRFP